MIRPLGRPDLDAVLDLWEALMANGTRADPRYVLAPGARSEMRDYVRDTWFRTDPFAHSWGADEDGLVAFLSIHPTQPLPILDRPSIARIGDLWVNPSHRRRGLARALVDHGVKAAREAGYPWVEVGTLARDAPAVAFWAALGFDDWMVTHLLGR